MRFVVTRTSKPHSERPAVRVRSAKVTNMGQYRPQRTHTYTMHTFEELFAFMREAGENSVILTIDEWHTDAGELLPEIELYDAPRYPAPPFVEAQPKIKAKRRRKDTAVA